MNNQVAQTILNQLGGNKFIAMTGVKNLLSDSNKLHMTLSKNMSKANRLTIILNENDTYTMRFFKFTMGKMDKNFNWIDHKEKEIELFDGIHDDQLQELFTMTTGLDTHL